jgi:hypothetical protein
MSIGIGLLAGAAGGVILALLLALRLKDGRKYAGAAALGGFLSGFLCLLIEDWAVHTRPVTTFAGLLPLVLVNVVTLAVLAFIIDTAVGLAGGDGHFLKSLSPATTVTWVAVLALGITWLSGYGGGHGGKLPCPTQPQAGHVLMCAKEAVGIVPVTEFSSDTLPASSTSNLVVVTGDEAATRASTAMSSGLAASRNFSTYLQLGPATLQMIDGVMEWVFPLEFDGSLSKRHLGGVEPGYIMVNAQDPQPPAVERYDGQYSMMVSLGGGQGSEPDRWAYDHGYSGYELDDPTLEIADSGLAGIAPGAPFWTVTLLAPQTGSTFQAPVGVLLINAHTGQITRYALPGRTAAQDHGFPPAPSWVDRIYSEKLANQIASWYGNYRWAGWSGQSNNNRFQVSGSPVLVYTGDGNPSWRILLTSFGTETSVYKIIEMDAASGAMQVYTPAEPMGIEATADSAFCNAQGIGATNVRANHLIPEDLTLHVIDGVLVWMTSYESSAASGSASGTSDEEGDTDDPCGTGESPVANPTFTGIGFVTAYNVSADNAVYGSDREQALANLGQQLAAQPGSNGASPSAGATTVTVTGTICAKNPDDESGTTVYYITLCGPGGKPDDSVAYYGSSLLGPAIVVAGPGDHVIVVVSKLSDGDSSQQMTSFSDAQHPITSAGTGTPALAPGASSSPAASATSTSAG